jgi:hypothetical protein
MEFGVLGPLLVLDDAGSEGFATGVFGSREGGNRW